VIEYLEIFLGRKRYISRGTEKFHAKLKVREKSVHERRGNLNILFFISVLKLFTKPLAAAIDLFEIPPL